MPDLLEDLRSYGEAVERSAVENASDRRCDAQRFDRTTDNPHQTRRQLALTASVILVLVLGAFTADWLLSREDEAGRVVIVDQPTSTTTDPTGPTGAEPTPEEIKAAEEGLAVYRQQEANGWVPYGSASAIPGGPHIEGWRRPTEGDMVTDFDDAGNVVGRHLERFPVYDKPDGAVIGYHYSGVGFVPLDQVEAFDPSAARVEVWGCDPYAPGCTPRPPGPTTSTDAG